MKKLIHCLSLVFAAGCLGGAVNSLAVWLFGCSGFTKALGVQIGPTLTAQWLYPRVVWGGIWGVLFLLPWLRKRQIVRGLVFSLGPSLVQLLIVFPFKAQKGFFGMDLGVWTFVIVLLANGVWGLTAAGWLKLGDGTKA